MERVRKPRRGPKTFAYETQMSLWGAILGHGNLVYHSAGWQEGGLTASFGAARKSAAAIRGRAGRGEA